LGQRRTLSVLEPWEDEESSFAFGPVLPVSDTAESCILRSAGWLNELAYVARCPLLPLKEMVVGYPQFGLGIVESGVEKNSVLKNNIPCSGMGT
jgi:hypothetical protein